MDIKTLEYMNERVKKGVEIQKKITALLEAKQEISLGREISINIYGVSYQRLLGDKEIKLFIISLIDVRISQLEKEFAEI